MNISKTLESIVSEYKLEVNGVSFWTPYFINTPQVSDEVKRKPLNAPYLGKGSPEELKGALLNALQESNDRPLAADEYRRFMHDHLIGVECSGFAYYVYDRLLGQLGLGSLDQHIYWSKSELIDAFDKGIPWHRPELSREIVLDYPEFINHESVCSDWGWKTPRLLIRADRFWSDHTAAKVDRVSELKPGDFIGMRESTGSNIGHLVIIVEVQDSKIRYAHSNRVDGTVGGVHFGDIELKGDLPIEEQGWLEKDFFNTHDRYSMYRLAVLDGKI